MSLFQTLICVIAILGFIIRQSYCEIMKNKMCVQFEFNNYFSNGTTIIDSIAGTTKKRCFFFCVCNNSCSAFHFRPKDGNCELLKTPEKCMSHDVTMGTVFVQLTKCGGSPPWKVVSPALNKLQWRRQYNAGDRKAVCTMNGGRGIVRALYQGMYITGFFWCPTRAETAFIVDMDDKQFHCFHYIKYQLTPKQQNIHGWIMTLEHRFLCLQFWGDIRNTERRFMLLVYPLQKGAATGNRATMTHSLDKCTLQRLKVPVDPSGYWLRIDLNENEIKGLNRESW